MCLWIQVKTLGCNFCCCFPFCWSQDLYKQSVVLCLSFEKLTLKLEKEEKVNTGVWTSKTCVCETMERINQSLEPVVTGTRSFAQLPPRVAHVPVLTQKRSPDHSGDWHWKQPANTHWQLFPSRAVVLSLPPCLASSSWMGGKHWQRQPKLQTLLCSQLYSVFIVSWLVCVNFVIYLHRCFLVLILLFIRPVGDFSSLTISQITPSSRDNIY